MCREIEKECVCRERERKEQRPVRVWGKVTVRVWVTVTVKVWGTVSLWVTATVRIWGTVRVWVTATFTVTVRVQLTPRKSAGNH